ncbi:MAG: TldD/PmbA family protein [Candidatus Nanohaloarchaea archaeon]|nr:TldD/PmbA family protein [Candidatus Nanohaloarchaea archaeon]
MFDEMEDAFDATGYDQLEVFAEEEESISCAVSDDRVDSVETEESRGIGVRALVDNKVGFAYTTDPETVLSTAERAVKLARLSQFRTISFPIHDDHPGVGGLYHGGTASIDEPSLVEQTREALEIEDARFAEGRVSRATGTTYIMNSSDVRASYDGTYFVSYFSASNDQRSKQWFDAARKRFDPATVSRRAYELLQESSDPVEVDQGERDVVLSPYAQYQIFSSLLYPAFDADRVQRGTSALKGKREEPIAADTLTIRDDGTREGGVNSQPFDREGTPAQETLLIEEGILRSFLYDVQRAEKEGIDSTGNAAGGYNNMPEIRPTNMVIEAEQGARDELGDGTIYIQDVAGVHTANTTSGDFSLNITTGFRLDGEGRTPISSGMFVGNLFDLLDSHRFSYGDRRTVDSLTTRNAVFRDQTVVN